MPGLFLYSVVLYAWPSRLDGVSLIGLLRWQYDSLSNWWFIYKLIPMLMLAPFLYVMFEALPDKMFCALAAIVAALTAWGAVSTTLASVFNLLGMPFKVELMSLATHLMPTQPIVGAGYFLYFCLGYFFRRLAPRLTRTQKRASIAVGLVLWFLDAALYGHGIDKADPSFYWLFVTFGIFVAFDGIKITSKAASTIITWLAKRSFAIYLTHFSLLDIVTRVVYEGELWGEVASMATSARVGIWIACVLIIYLSSLGIVSIIDVTLVRGAQWLWKKLCSLVPPANTQAASQAQ